MKKLLGLLPVLFYSFLSAQISYTTLNAHSHNDYEQKVPFEWAYNAHFGSIEADIWAVNGELFVAHHRGQIVPKKTLDALYIRPIVDKFKENKGKAWNDYEGTFQLLIDLKTSAEPTLSILAEKLKKYPEVFNPTVNPNAVKIVITGNRPNPEQFDNYPEFIFFDGLLKLHYNESQLKRVALFSDNLWNHTKWKGEGEIPASDLQKLTQVIDSVHQLKRRVRFWNAPDTPQAWQLYKDWNIDIINTDHIEELESFLSK